MRRRLLAIVALLAAAATIALAVAVAVGEFPRGLLLLACGLIAGTAGWYGAPAAQAARVVGLIVAGLGLAGALVLLVTRGRRWSICWSWGLLVSLATARAAFTVHVDLPSASAPRQPVLVYNPKSGGGKRSASRWPRRLAGVGSRRSSSGAVTTSRRWSAPQSRGAPTGWPWPVGTARRPSSPPSPRS